jgi:hypothetical protein
MSDGKIGVATCAITHILSYNDDVINWKMIHDTIKEQIVDFVP